MANLSHLTVSPLPPCSLGFLLLINDDVMILIAVLLWQSWQGLPYLVKFDYCNSPWFTRV
jgi:hypothetical protein